MSRRQRASPPRHLLNQASGFSHSDSVAPLVRQGNASVEELARGLATVSLNRPVGERFEYSNLNSMLLGAVLEAVTRRSWPAQVQHQVFQPLQMKHTYVDHDAGRQGGMTAVHRMWFGRPVPYQVRLPPGLAPAGSVVRVQTTCLATWPCCWPKARVRTVGSCHGRA